MGTRSWIIIGAVAMAIIAIVLMVKPAMYDDQATWSARQDRGAAEQAPTSSEPSAPSKSSGAGSGSDSARGEGSVPTGTAK